MNVLTFKLSGNTAFFKQPDVNSHKYFTYGNIHKVALFGIFGAILGLDGYGQQQKSDLYPAFYEKLQHIKVAIRPLNARGYIPKKIQTFNNSIGYASKEPGGNLIIREQWLESPAWQIYLQLDDTDVLLQDLKNRLIANRCVYLPYLGKNDHYANIENVEICEAIVLPNNEPIQLNSLFLKSSGILSPLDNLFSDNDELDFKYEERLPVSLDNQVNQYQTELFIYTNIPVQVTAETVVHQIDNNNLIFF